MDSKNDIRQLQQLCDAIAITLDALRRIAPTAWNGAARNDMGWIPAPGFGAQAGGARLEHSAWPEWTVAAPPPWPAMAWPTIGGWGPRRVF